LQDLGFPLSDEEEMEYNKAMEGIDLDDIDADTEDEDLLDEVEEPVMPGNKAGTQA
jgi:hypothetical protein